MFERNPKKKRVSPSRDNSKTDRFVKRSCSGKHRYATEYEAEAEIKRLQHGSRKIEKLTYYYCPFCGGFHLCKKKNSYSEHPKKGKKK